ncbi:MAG: fasciclin domain-containing protein [Phormidesmis sp.]
MQLNYSPRQAKKLTQRFLIGFVASSAGALMVLPSMAMSGDRETIMEVSEATEVPVGAATEEATEATESIEVLPEEVIVEPTAAETLPATEADMPMSDPVAETEMLEAAPVVEADEATEAPVADTETADEAPVADTETSDEAPVAEEPATETEAADAAGDIVTEDYTITELTGNSDSFDVFTAAIQAAGLTEELSGEGPFTVFAPTDEAFEALPEGFVDQLLLPENKAVLRQILTYHVVPGEVPAAELETGSIATVEGEDIAVVADDTFTTVNSANVIFPDVIASNGIIHVIDSVIVPPEPEADADTSSPAADQ